MVPNLSNVTQMALSKIVDAAHVKVEAIFVKVNALKNDGTL